tara:strand:+ start:626 stop:1120 length:495 start_codon:yes stop_codon:yes gene_type:complete
MALYKVIDEFLNQNQFKPIQDYMVSPSPFSWNYMDGVVGHDDPVGSFQFTHTFYQNLHKSDHIDVILPILSQLNPYVLMRIKANLNVRTDTIQESSMHTDFEGLGNTTAIYYLNTCNGYTMFQDGTKVDSVANRMVIFDGDTLHAGTTCTDEKTRVVINFNYHG